MESTQLFSTPVASRSLLCTPPHLDRPESCLLREEFLCTAPSGDLFGWTQDAGMGWDSRKLGGPEVVILSTQGGVRREDGSPIENTLVTHVAFGGSTSLILHLPAIAHAAGLERPTVDDWHRVKTPFPMAPTATRQCRYFSPAALPEVMLHLRDLGLLRLDAPKVTGQSLGDNLDW